MFPIFHFIMFSFISLFFHHCSGLPHLPSLRHRICQMFCTSNIPNFLKFIFFVFCFFCSARTSSRAFDFGPPIPSLRNNFPSPSSPPSVPSPLSPPICHCICLFSLYHDFHDIFPKLLQRPGTPCGFYRERIQGREGGGPFVLSISDLDQGSIWRTFLEKVVLVPLLNKFKAHMPSLQPLDLPTSTYVLFNSSCIVCFIIYHCTTNWDLLLPPLVYNLPPTYFFIFYRTQVRS